MHIQVTGPGRRGTIDQGVGRLSLKAETNHESKKLGVIYQEIRDGNFGFWTPIMWAAEQGKLSKSQTKMLESIVGKVADEFMEFCGE